MKNSILFAFILLLFTNCSLFGAKHNIEVKIRNLKDKEIIVKVNDVAQTKRLLDTVINCKNGKFTFDKEFSEPVYVTFTPKSGLIDTRKIRGVVERETMKIGIYVVAGETYTINGTLDGNMLYYDVSGSEINNVLSKQRNKYLEADKYFDMESEYFRDDKSKTMRDSVYLIGKEIKRPLNEEQFEYLKNNLNSPLSALFLSEFAISIFNEYYDKIGENVKNSIFKPLLETKKWYSELAKNNKEMSVGADEIDFTLKGLKENSITLSTLKGRYVLLYFWGSWCRWCISGLPNLNQFHNDFGEKVTIIGIACSDKESALKKVIQEHNIQWDNFMDTDKLSFKYGISGYPTKILLNPEGKVVFRYEGEHENFYKKILDYL